MISLTKKINISQIYLYLYLLFALTLPLSRAGISIFIAIITIIWIIEGKFQEKFQKILNNYILILLLSLIALVYISLAWSSNIDLKTITKIDYKYLLFIPISYTIIKKEWTQKIITSFLAGIFISEVASYGIYFGLWTLKHGTQTNPAPFMNHIEYSVFLSFSAILLLSRLFSSYFTNKEKLFIFPFFITVVGNLFLTGGRTGQIAFIAAIIIMFILHYRISVKSILLSVVTISIIYLSAYNVSDTFHKRSNKLVSELKLISTNDLTSSVGIRLTYFILAYDTFKDDPKKILFGVGYNDYFEQINYTLDNNLNTTYKKYSIDTTFVTNSRTHNQYLQILFETGVIGLLLFILLLYSIIKAKYDIIEMKHLSILFVTIFSISCLSDIMIEVQFTRTLFILFVSLFIINIKQTESNTFT